MVATGINIFRIVFSSDKSFVRSTAASLDKRWPPPDRVFHSKNFVNLGGLSPISLPDNLCCPDHPPCTRLIPNFGFPDSMVPPLDEIHRPALPSHGDRYTSDSPGTTLPSYISLDLIFFQPVLPPIAFHHSNNRLQHTPLVFIRAFFPLTFYFKCFPLVIFRSDQDPQVQV